LLLLSPPGVGKSETVVRAAEEAGLPCRSLLGTQIAPEDVSGIPRIVGERSVFCPPRVLLPEHPEPFCLFLDELPAAQPDVQKALYSLLLERRLGEHLLPAGSWVVAAGNRAEDRALVRTLSSALVNRVFVLQIRADAAEWLAWAARAGVRPEVRAFIRFVPEAIHRGMAEASTPFSTPRAWTSLSRAMDLAERAGVLDGPTVRALAFGRVSAMDALVFCTMVEERVPELQPVETYLHAPSTLPSELGPRWFVLNRIRNLALAHKLRAQAGEADAFLRALSLEERFVVLTDAVDAWGQLGAAPAMLDTLREAVGAEEASAP
jgi:hypothetical protein